jgi:hypothetical protein
MTNLLTSVILSGLAVTFTIEFLALGLSMFIQKETIYAVFSLPFSFAAMCCFYSINIRFVVLVTATAFVVLVTNKVLNKPVIVNASRRQLPKL